MNSRKWMLAIPLLAMSLVGCTNEIGKVVRRYGYTEVRPPSRLLLPGTVIHVKSRSPLVARIVCTQQATLGKDFALPADQISPAPDLTRDLQSNNKLGLSADQLQTIKASLGISAIEQVNLKMSNVKVQEVAWSDVLERLGQRSPACSQAIESLVNANEAVSIVQSVLEADVQYDVDFSRGANLSAEAKLDVMKKLAVQLGANADTATQESVRGTGLFWGVVDEVKLVQAGGPKDDSRVRLLPQNDNVTIEPTPMVEE